MVPQVFEVGSGAEGESWWIFLCGQDDDIDLAGDHHAEHLEFVADSMNRPPKEIAARPEGVPVKILHFENN